MIFRSAMLWGCLLLSVELASSELAYPRVEPLYSVPAAIKERGHFVVDGVINGDWELPLVVDTGAMVALLPSSAPRRLAIEPGQVRDVQATTASDVSALQSITLDSIRVGEDSIENVTAILRDLDMYDSFTATPGVLPFSFLDRYTVHFDLAAGRLEFYSPDIPIDRLLDSSSYSRVEFERPMGFIQFDLIVNGERVPTILDTGAGGMPIMNWAAAEALGVGRDHPGLKEGSDIRGAGHSGLDSVGFSFDTVAIGSESLAVPRIDIADMPHFRQLVGEGPAANIGLQQLRGGSLFIDFARQVLYVRNAPGLGVAAAD